MALKSETPLEGTLSRITCLCLTRADDLISLNFSLTHFNGIGAYLVEL